MDFSSPPYMQHIQSTCGLWSYQFEGVKCAYFSLCTGCEEELLSCQNEFGTRTTVILKLKGDLDIMLSPLVLESLQKYVKHQAVLCEMWLLVAWWPRVSCYSRNSEEIILLRLKNVLMLNLMKFTVPYSLNQTHTAVTQCCWIWYT